MRVVVRRRMKQRKAIRPGVGVLIISTGDREQSPALDFVNMKSRGNEENTFLFINPITFIKIASPSFKMSLKGSEK